MKTSSLVLCEFAETGIAGIETFSPFCLKVRRALRAAGLPHTSRRAHDPGDFRALNPAGQLPILLVDDAPIADSTAILRAIRAAVPAAFPGNACAGEALLWEELADSHLNGFLVASRWADEANWPSVRQAYFGQAPWPVRALIVPRLRAKVLRSLYARDVVRAGMAACWASFEATLDALDERAPREGFWLAAGFSTADVALSSQLDALRTPLTPRQATLVGARARLCRWLDRVDAHVRRGPRPTPGLDADLRAAAPPEPPAAAVAYLG